MAIKSKICRRMFFVACPRCSYCCWTLMKFRAFARIRSRTSAASVCYHCTIITFKRCRMGHSTHWKAYKHCECFRTVCSAGWQKKPLGFCFFSCTVFLIVVILPNCASIGIWLGIHSFVTAIYVGWLTIYTKIQSKLREQNAMHPNACIDAASKLYAMRNSNVWNYSYD